MINRATRKRINVSRGRRNGHVAGLVLLLFVMPKEKRIFLGWDTTDLFFRQYATRGKTSCRVQLGCVIKTPKYGFFVARPHSFDRMTTGLPQKYKPRGIGTVGLTRYAWLPTRNDMTHSEFGVPISVKATGDCSSLSFLILSTYFLDTAGALDNQLPTTYYTVLLGTSKPTTCWFRYFATSHGATWRSMLNPLPS